METLDYLYNQISKTETTLIGYRFSDERIKDEIISNLGRTKIIDLSSSFSMKSIFRDNRESDSHKIIKYDSIKL